MQDNPTAKNVTGDTLFQPWRFSFSEVLESFYLETVEGLFFAVKGSEHPPDRVISVLRYAPDPQNGNRIKAGVWYRRFYRFAEQEQFLRSHYPHFLAYDSVFQTTLQSVPAGVLRGVYDPRLRLKEIAESSPAAGIEKDAAEFGKLLQKASGVPSFAIGISGSLLIGLQTDGSDLDFSVFGNENCRKVHDALRTLLDSQSIEGLRRLDRAGLEELYSQREVDTHMPFEEFAALEKMKTCQGSFQGRPYFVRFIKEAHETGDTYGSVRYTPIGRTSITATIADDCDSIFTPCRYILREAQVVQGPPVCVDEIVSFRGRFCEQTRRGESIRATGTLERLDKSNGEISNRLLLGNSPEDILISSTA